jgi:putative transcriptional regulator
MNLANNLKALRKKRCWSQEKLAKEAIISVWVLTKIEQGSSKKPTIVTMAKIADALEISIDELIGRKVKKRNQRQHGYPPK